MPCKKKGNPEKHRKHTPIVSKKQQGFMGAELARKRAGEKTKTGMTEKQLSQHLEESAGKKLPLRAKKKKLRRRKKHA